MPFTRKWTSEEDSFLRENYLTKNYSDVALALDRSNRAIRLRRIALNLPLKLKRVPVNEHFFDKIETPIQAYLLGLLAGDGWVGKTSAEGYGLHLGLKNSDKELVELLRDNLSPQKAIYYCPKQARFCTRLSPRFYNLLAKDYGIVSGRKPTYRIPLSIPFALITEFILGYFDADGSLYKTNRGHYVWSLCGSLPLVREVAALIQDDLGIIIHPPRPHCKTVWLYYLYLHSLEKIRKVDTWLHRSGLGLDRKKLPPTAAFPRQSS